MKKAFFFSLALLLLSSCQSAPAFDAAKEESELKEKTIQEDQTSDRLALFQVSFTYTYLEKDSLYYYQFILDSVQEELKNARVLLEVKENYYTYFGYQSAYTLIPNNGTSDKEKHIVKGFSIAFSSTSELTDKMKTLFKSDTKEECFYSIPAKIS